MKRAYIGNSTIDTTKPIFVCNKPFSEMRQNEVRQYAYIDLLQEKANLTNDENVLKDIYDQMDYYFCVSCLCEKFGHDVDLLNKVSYYFFDKMDSFFSNQYKDLDERNTNLNRTIETIMSNCVDNISINTNVTDEQKLWWKENVLDLNYFCVNFEKSDNFSQDVAIGSITDFVTSFKESGDAYCYTLCDKSKLSTRAKAKLDGLIKLRRYLSDSDINLDYNTQTLYIQSKIYQSTQGGTANDEVEALKAEAKSKNRIGIAPAVIAAIISVACTLACTIIGVVHDNKMAKNAETQNVVNEANRYMPNSYDFMDFFDSNGDGQIDMKWWLIGLGIIGIAYYYS